MPALKLTSSSSSFVAIFHPSAWRTLKARFSARLARVYSSVRFIIPRPVAAFHKLVNIPAAYENALLLVHEAEPLLTRPDIFDRRDTAMIIYARLPPYFTVCLAYRHASLTPR